jgi:hypothetical protein
MIFCPNGAQGDRFLHVDANNHLKPSLKVALSIRDTMHLVSRQAVLKNIERYYA